MSTHHPLFPAAAAALLLGGCGFHLQGHKALPAPLRVTYVQAADVQSDFVQDLRKALLTSGAHLTTDKDDATAVVRVLTDNFQRRVLSVTAQDQPAEYEITYTVRVAVDFGEKEVLPVQELSGVRDYTFDESILLAKENEEAILREALAHDLADVIMRRLANL
jgi:LPS-assembly lipoprotein